jgi:hypothetical protein
MGWPPPERLVQLGASMTCRLIGTDEGVSVDDLGGSGQAIGTMRPLSSRAIASCEVRPALRATAGLLQDAQRRPDLGDGRKDAIRHSDVGRRRPSLQQWHARQDQEDLFGALQVEHSFLAHGTSAPSLATAPRPTARPNSRK